MSDTDTNDAKNTRDETSEVFTVEQMREVREEAKSWRLKLRAEEERTKQLTADREAATQQVNDLNGQLERHAAAEQLRKDAIEVAAASGVPAEVLRGSSRDELEAHAEQIRKIMTATTSRTVIAAEGGPRHQRRVERGQHRGRPRTGTQHELANTTTFWEETPVMAITAATKLSDFKGYLKPDLAQHYERPPARGQQCPACPY